MRRSGARQHVDKASGFSLLEMMMVMALLLILGSIAHMMLVPLLNQQHVRNAYNTTLEVMRQARDNAVAQQTVYEVTFSTTASPNTITVTPILPTGDATTSFTGQQNTVTYTLPTDVFFLTQTGFPNTTATAPDSYYNSALQAVDLGYAANGYTSGVVSVYFCPDGTAQNSQDGAGNCSGSWDGGVVYLGQTGNLLSSRAITLWGATGHIHGWRLYSSGATTYQWLRQ
jgi:prepilin-type N-terminal cleavage/methylation domain-containing protein